MNLIASVSFLWLKLNDFVHKIKLADPLPLSSSITQTFSIGVLSKVTIVYKSEGPNQKYQNARQLKKKKSKFRLLNLSFHAPNSIAPPTHFTVF